jgi:hypothetical protein
MPLQPREEPFDQPAPLIAAQSTTVLRPSTLCVAIGFLPRRSSAMCSSGKMLPDAFPLLVA